MLPQSLLPVRLFVGAGENLNSDPQSPKLLLVNTCRSSLGQIQPPQPPLPNLRTHPG